MNRAARKQLIADAAEYVQNADALVAATDSVELKQYWADRREFYLSQNGVDPEFLDSPLPVLTLPVLSR